MTKLHELLAVESNLEKQANDCSKDLANTFEKKRHHFEEKRVVFRSNEENSSQVTEVQSDIQTTVNKELNEWLLVKLSKLYDASLQVAEANTRAKADVVLEDGTVLVKDVPATALLELEKRLVEVKNLVFAAPTLDPTKGFKVDTTRGDDFYVAREVTKNRTRKTKKAFQLAPATDKHPAQVQLIEEDVVVGVITEQEWSSMLTVVQKGDMLDRVEELIRSVRRARSKANEVEVDSTKKFGNKLLNYVFKGAK
jgi:LysM repeat protein